MSYQNIDRKRYEYLLRFGTEQPEIRKFFKDCQRQLILHGAKVQNLPPDNGASIRMLTTGMPPSTDEIVRSWFSKHLATENIEEPEIIIAVYKRFEETNLYLSPEATRRYARSCLIHIFSTEPPTSLIDFLKMPIIDKSTLSSESASNQVIGPISHISLQDFAQILIDIVEGKDVNEYMEHFPPGTAEFISGLQAGLESRIQEVKSAVESIPSDSVFRNSLEEYIKRADERLINNRKADTDIFNGDFDYDFDEVLGYCTKADKPTAVFVRPLSVVRGDQILQLTDEIRSTLFPQHGDLIAFAGPGYPQQPRAGEFGIWKVEEHDTDKATHFHIASERRAVYQIQSIPFCSTDYDNVRESIKKLFTQSVVGHQSYIYHLSDGIFVGSKSDRKIDFSKDESFEQGLFSWKSLPTVRFDGRILAISPLPNEYQIYDCASLTSTVRKLFKHRNEEEKSSDRITKSQLSNLIHSLSSFDIKLDDFRIQRIKAQLEELMEREDSFDTLLQELMNLQLIKQRVDELIEQKAERQLTEKNDLQAVIERLRQEEKDWRGRVRKQSEEFRKLPDNVSKAVKTAFDKVRSDGLSTIGELAVFKALFEVVPNHNANSDATNGNLGIRPQPIMQDLMIDCGDDVSTLKKFGVLPRNAKAFSLVGQVARKAGLMICVRGMAARPVVEGWAGSLSQHGLLLNSTIGLIDDSITRNALTKLPTLDVLAILDANLSALDIYARPLLDFVLKRLVEPETKQQTTIFFSLTDSIGALPLPKNFERISISINLDTNYDFHNNDLDELKLDAFHPDDGYLFKCMWRPAVNILKKQIETFNEEDQKLIFSVLKN
jgi:DNA-binding HxlR family transcriptional regulator